mmetsp:Transcript_128642/g.274526  ORF Transcript_128642/g.274526 Transcript_128642/m.274526 type:complete len:252 (+) Transcript_128642:2-757(+)
MTSDACVSIVGQAARSPTRWKKSMRPSTKTSLYSIRSKPAVVAQPSRETAAHPRQPPQVCVTRPSAQGRGAHQDRATMSLTRRCRSCARSRVAPCQASLLVDAAEDPAPEYAHHGHKGNPELQWHDREGYHVHCAPHRPVQPQGPPERPVPEVLANHPAPPNLQCIALHSTHCHVEKAAAGWRPHQLISEDLRSNRSCGTPSSYEPVKGRDKDGVQGSPHAEAISRKTGCTPRLIVLRAIEKLATCVPRCP